VKATKKVLGAMLYSLVMSLSQFQDNPRPQKSFSRGGREEGAKAFEKNSLFSRFFLLRTGHIDSFLERSQIRERGGRGREPVQAKRSLWKNMVCRKRKKKRKIERQRNKSQQCEFTKERKNKV